jgi:hypothetical protein
VGVGAEIAVRAGAHSGNLAMAKVDKNKVFKRGPYRECDNASAMVRLGYLLEEIRNGPSWEKLRADIRCERLSSGGKGIAYRSR